MMIKPVVSVIIPTYNHPQWLNQAIESALNQSYPSVDVIVVSDGTPTNEVLQAAARYPLVRFLQQDHYGAGAARNTGLAASKGEFIQFLDDDDWLLPEAVALKKSLLESRSDIGCVYSDIFLVSDDGQALGSQCDGRPRPLPQGDIFESLLKNNFILVHAPLWRRTILEQVGGFPQHTGAEDWELLVRCAEITFFDCLDRPLGYYRLHKQNATLDFSRQMAGNGLMESYVVSSPRFAHIKSHKQARILSSYAFQQWLYGDVALGLKFYSRARHADPLHPYPFMLKGLMLLGRPLVRCGMQKVWLLRNRIHPSSGLYFLTKS